MIFIGQASNYSWTRSWKQVFVGGHSRDAERLKEALAKRYKSSVECVRLYHSGRSALAAAIVATVPKGAKVLVPGLTCIAVVRAVKAAGCEPEFCDIAVENLQYDLQKLAEKVKNDTEIRGIIIQNTLGVTIDMAKVEEIIGKKKIAIIEDLAHAAGQVYPDKREVGTVGDATILSFGKGKAIDTISGGALILRNEQLVMPNEPAHLPKKSDQWRDRWYPVFGRHMRFWTHLKLGKFYTAALLKLHFIQRSADAELDLDVKLPNWQARLVLPQIEGMKKQKIRDYRLVERRGELLEELHQKGIYLNEIWYDTPVSPERYQKEANFPDKECPNTVRVAEQIVNIPLWYKPEKLVPVYEIIQKYEVEDGGE